MHGGIGRVIVMIRNLGYVVSWGSRALACLKQVMILHLKLFFSEALGLALVTNRELLRHQQTFLLDLHRREVKHTQSV